MITAESEYSPGSRLERCLADEEGREADKRLRVRQCGNKLNNWTEMHTQRNSAPGIPIRLTIIWKSYDQYQVVSKIITPERTSWPEKTLGCSNPVPHGMRYPCHIYICRAETA
jgi:hypothetical protein